MRLKLIALLGLRIRNSQLFRMNKYQISCFIRKSHTCKHLEKYISCFWKFHNDSLIIK